MFERRLRLAMWSGVINSAFFDPVHGGTRNSVNLHNKQALGK